MRPVRLLLLPVVLPTALWACGSDPGPALERVRGRGMLFAESASAPPLPPDWRMIHRCPETGKTGDPAPLPGRQAQLELAHGRP